MSLQTVSFKLIKNTNVFLWGHGVPCPKKTKRFLKLFFTIHFEIGPVFEKAKDIVETVKKIY